MMNCVACQISLTGGLDTYGPPDQPLCMACHFEVNEYVEKMNSFDASSYSDEEADDDAGADVARRTLAFRQSQRNRDQRLFGRHAPVFVVRPPHSEWHQNGEVQS